MNISGPFIFFRLKIFGLEINVTQTMLTSAVVTVILITAGILLGRNLKKRPGGMQVMTEKGVSLIYGLVTDAMGEWNAHWTPYLATLFLSSLLGSLLGMTGILRSSTGDLSTTATWAVMTTLIIWVHNIKNIGLKAWLKGFTEPIAVMTPMNIVSEFAQPVSLAFRHFGNIAGGGVITVMIYWALSGGSAVLLRLAAKSGIAVSIVLLAVSALLLFVLKYKSGKSRLAGKAVGVLTGIFGLLSAAQTVSEWCSFAYPELPAGLCAGLYFLCLAVILTGVAFLLSSKKKWRRPAGIAAVALGLCGIVFICGGPSQVPFLQFGIPAVLSLYFDVFSGVMQAFVFTLLSMIYISGACPPPEERIRRGRKKDIQPKAN